MQSLRRAFRTSIPERTEQGKSSAPRLRGSPLQRRAPILSRQTDASSRDAAEGKKYDDRQQESRNTRNHQSHVLLAPLAATPQPSRRVKEPENASNLAMGLLRDKTRKPGKPPLSPTYRAAGRRLGARAASGRSNPFDRPDAGEGGGGQLAVGAAHPQGPPARAASYPDRSSCRTTRSLPRSSRTSLASTSILPPMPLSSRSTRRARSRRSTAPSRACR